MATDDLPGPVPWKDETVTVDGLEVSPSDTAKVQSRTLGPGIIARVTDVGQLSDYLDSHQREKQDVPEYYSKFPDERRATLIEADDILDDEYDSSALAAEPVWFAMRALNGNGRYPAAEHVLHDCLPYPCIVERHGVGAVAVSPRVQPAESDGSEDDVIVIE